MNKIYEYMQYEKAKKEEEEKYQTPPPSPPLRITSPTYSPTSPPAKSAVNNCSEMQQDVAIIMSTLDCIKMELDNIKNGLEKEKEEELDVSEDEEDHSPGNAIKKFNSMIHQLFNNMHVGKFSITENKYWYEISAMIKKESDN